MTSSTNRRSRTAIRTRGPLGAGLAAAAFWAVAPQAALAAPGDGAPADAAPAKEAPTGFWERDTALGDLGFRSAWKDAGVVLSANNVLDVLDNTTGGTRQGGIVMGKFEMALDLDLEVLAGWHGATIHANAYAIEGGSLSRAHLASNINPVSGFEALRDTKLYSLWLQFPLLDDKLSVKIGQMALDEEYPISTGAANFVNASFGTFPAIAANMPSGGPAYPLATPGLRVRYAINDAWNASVAVFNGDPAGAPGPQDPQIRAAGGTRFATDRDALILGEVADVVAADPQAGTGAAATKIGVLYHTGTFSDPRFDIRGLSLAAPGSSGVAASHRGDYVIYGVIDRTLWLDPAGDDRGLSGFIRLAMAPDDRNLVSFYGEAGLTYKGLLDERPADVAGLAFGLAQVGDRTRGLDRDLARYAGRGLPVRNYEAVIEATYAAVITPWATIQPDVQVILHPGAGIAQPSDPTGTTRIGDAFVLGWRTIVKF